VRAYSHRFHQTSEAGTVYGYVVPAGFRLVVKMVAAANSTAAAGRVFLYIDGRFVWGRAVPGDSSVDSAGLHVVLYAGETLGALANVPGLTMGVHGYLLEDQSGSAAAPGERREWSLVHVEALPTLPDHVG
jgi:hypothetical protein